jgi:predicted DNA binding CopG/RHH family protein
MRFNFLGFNLQKETTKSELNVNKKYMRKLIDIKSKDVEPLKILAVKAGKDLKNYIQDVLSEHVLKVKK